jgi:polyphenol oxidase
MTDKITHPSLANLPGICHGFFTRQGGVSSGIYQSLNCGVGSDDTRALVVENRARVSAALGLLPDRLATPYQVHGKDAVTVTSVWHAGQGPKADALVTDRPGIALGVGTADCGPTLFADAEAGIIAAAHSGWKGALAGILDSTIEAMENLGAKRQRIVAVLGPMISQENYEVGPELLAQFVEAEETNARFFKSSPRPGHSLFDLPAYILARLAKAGINATAIGLCTYADEERFYSYRRATHMDEPDYGRLLSAIALVEA